MHPKHRRNTMINQINTCVMSEFNEYLTLYDFDCLYFQNYKMYVYWLQK